MAAVRRADSSWEGDLISGSGVVSASTSKAFSDLPVTWASRTESAEGRTSPEELLAAAHAACYSMAFSGDLAKAGSPPERIAWLEWSGSNGPGKLVSSGAIIVAFFSQVTPWSNERTTATDTPWSFALWFANTTRPSTSVSFGRTLMMLPIVPAWVPGL